MELYQYFWELENNLVVKSQENPWLFTFLLLIPKKNSSI